MLRLLSLMPILALAAACGDGERPIDDPCVDVDGELASDGYGGDGRVELTATGWFRVASACGRSWLATPDGHPFYSIGINSLRYGSSAGQTSGIDPYRENLDEIYASEAAFAEVAVARLESWGFTTAGSWSKHELFADYFPFTINLSLSGGDWQSGAVADFYDPAWVTWVGERVDTLASPSVDSPNLVGYFIDNEIRWGTDWRGNETLLQLYLAFAADAPGKAVAVDFLLAELGDLAAVNLALATNFASRADMLAAIDGWGELDDGESETEATLTTAFLERTAARYFQTTHDAIRAVDDHHLIIGNREVSVTTRVEVYLAAAPYVDVLSINNYVFGYGIGPAAITLSGAIDPVDWFAALHQIVDLPIMISEFGFRALDSGLPNSWPPIYPTWEYQEDRAREFTDYARGAQATPWIVGYHWFAWADQPAEGRFDGEDNNWGLVNVDDEAYSLLTDQMAVVNGEIWDYLRTPRE